MEVILKTMESEYLRKNELSEKLLAYYEESCLDQSVLTGSLISQEAREFIVNNANAFIFGLISDQSTKAELAWSLPFRLKKRLGHYDMHKMGSEGYEHEIEAAIKDKPALHRYPGRIANYLYLASKHIIDNYQGNGANIWSNTDSAKEIIGRLCAFKGISSKKAALGTMLLVRDKGVYVKDAHIIDIAYDIHVRRVFLRIGLVKSDTLEQVTEVAKLIYPDFPGKLTTPIWVIGREYCRPTNPLCDNCPISNLCERKIHLGGDIRA
ncbi:endonuclease III [Clostridium botulinum]|nr:endonuclease III [Clostridium botulinum]NFI97262.1 endonuclease III [Clostridium botulinum]NFJ11820.1 endonuclease III [Clostridium botulinum]NFJ99381.1 endonuclease III [Clostridium botulinum]NFK04818.1 endonuclease III [Clostridium botulinum]